MFHFNRKINCTPDGKLAPLYLLIKRKDYNCCHGNQATIRNKMEHRRMEMMMMIIVEYIPYNDPLCIIKTTELLYTCGRANSSFAFFPLGVSFVTARLGHPVYQYADA